MALLVKYSPTQPPVIDGSAPGYGPQPPVEGARVQVEGARLTLETDLFATHPLHVLVRDGKLWAADSLQRLTREPDVPRGLLPMGIAATLCVAPARRPSLCASGLSLLPSTRTVCENGKIQTTPLGLPPCDESYGPATTQTLAAALDLRIGKEAEVWLQDEWSVLLLAALTERGANRRAWIMARSGVMVEGAASLAQSLGAEPMLVSIAEEDLPEYADAAITACETLLSDSAAVANFAFFKATRVSAMLSSVGAAALFDVISFRDNVPRFVWDCQPECDLAHYFLRTEWAKRVKRHDWRAEFSGENEVKARELLLRTELPHHALPEQALTAAAHGVELRTPFLDRAIAALRGTPWPLRHPRPELGPVVLSSRARRNWILWLDTRLSFDRLERLEVIDSGKVRRELIQYGKLHTEAPRRVLLERVFFKLASLTVLQEYWS